MNTHDFANSSRIKFGVNYGIEVPMQNILETLIDHEGVVTLE